MPTPFMVPPPPVVSPKTTVGAQAATATLVVADLQKIITNTGASGTVTLTLPSAATVAGLSFRVQVTVAQIVRIAPATGQKIFLGGDGVASKYLQIAGVIGNYAEIYCDGVDFLVMHYSGVLTKEA